MLKVKCFPETKFFLDFLKSRGVVLTDKNPNVLHFFGTNKKQLAKLLKKDKPDFLITHKKEFFKDFKCFQAFHFLKDKADLERISKVYTNQFELARTYYQILGLQVYFKTIPSGNRKANARREVNFLWRLGFQLVHLYQKFKDYLMWD